MFKRKKKTPVEAAGEEWHVYAGMDKGRPLLARFNAAYMNTDRSTHPIQIGVAVPLRAHREDGLPDDAEIELLDGIEKHLEEHTAGRAALVGVITGNGVREFVLYTRTGEWIEGFHRALQASVPTHEIQVMAQTDPKWRVYSTLVQ